MVFGNNVSFYIWLCVEVATSLFPRECDNGDPISGLLIRGDSDRSVNVLKIVLIYIFLYHQFVECT